MRKELLRTTLIIAGIGFFLTSGISEGYATDDSEPTFKPGAPKKVIYEKISCGDEEDGYSTKLVGKHQETKDGETYLTKLYYEFDGPDGKMKAPYDGESIGTDKGWVTYSTGKIG